MSRRILPDRRQNFMRIQRRCAGCVEKTQEYIRAHFSVDGAWKVIEEDFAWDGQGDVG